MSPAPEEPWVAGKLADAAEGGVLPTVGRLWKVLSAARSLSFSANVTVWRHGSLTESGSEARAVGRWDYWEANGQLRSRLDLPLDLGFAPFLDVAVSDSARQSLDLEDRLLTLSSSDSRRMPTPLPNPIFLPFESLALHDDEQCFRCEFRAADFKFAPKPKIVPRTGATHKTGGIVFGEPATYDAKESANGLEIIERRQQGPSRRISIHGSLRAKGESHALIPQKIHLEYFSPEGLLIQTIDYAFDSVSINRPIDSSVFSISWKGLRQIWDEDQGSFAHRVPAE